MKFIKLVIILAVILSGCQASLKEQESKTIKAVQQQVKAKPKKHNNKVKDIQFYLPFGFEIDEKSPNNIILKNGSKTYILFYNTHEGVNSDIVYHSTVNQHKKIDLKKTWQENEQFSFLLVDELEDGLNELIVGKGGIKLTSEVKSNNLPTEAAQMMQIVNSVKLIKKKKAE